MVFTRITTDAALMGGVPCIQGLRIPVATVIAMIADGLTPQDVVDDLPDLDLGDVREALHYAASAVSEPELPLRHTA